MYAISNRSLRVVHVTYEMPFCMEKSNTKSDTDFGKKLRVLDITIGGKLSST
jgi:hypothetical protein